MSNLQLVTTEKFNGVICDFYNKDGQVCMTRNQIGQALEYDEPRKMIAKIHERHRDRLDKFSGVVSLGTPSGVQETYLYSQRGVFEICRWSRQPKADAFMDWVWDVIEDYRSGELRKTSLLPQNDFSTLCNQVNSLDAEMDSFYDRLNALEEIITKTSEPALAYTETPNNTVIDPIRDTIEPLAKLYNDGSIGYNCTFRKVYNLMGCDWKNRRTRYKNQNGNKTPPSNIKLIEQDKKLLKLFVDTVNQLMENALAGN